MSESLDPAGSIKKKQDFSKVKLIAFFAIGAGVMFVIMNAIDVTKSTPQADLQQELVKQNHTINLLINATGRNIQFQKDVIAWSQTVENRINLLNETGGKK